MARQPVVEALRCQGTTKKGVPCTGYKQHKADFCIAHDPSITREQRRAWAGTPHVRGPRGPRTPSELVNYYARHIEAIDKSFPADDVKAAEALSVLGRELRAAWRDARDWKAEADGQKGPRSIVLTYTLENAEIPQSVSPSLQGEALGSKTGGLAPKNDVA